jgi:hypothetical protein
MYGISGGYGPYANHAQLNRRATQSDREVAAITTDLTSPEANHFLAQAASVIPVHDWLGSNLDITA